MVDTTNSKKRELIVWEIPSLSEGEYVEMYLNPENIQFSSSKIITETRTKGGFVTQYWGENLDEVNIQGTTGDGGIEAINVLRDIYKNEQITLINLLKQRSPGVKRRQSLMQLAASVVMWYQGQGYQGYFTNMSYTESVGKLGMFDYQMNFKVTAIYGRRRNFMPWHRSPWSTVERPSVAHGDRMSGGAYATNYKLGEMNTPSYNIEKDPETGEASVKPNVNFDPKLNVARIPIADLTNPEAGNKVAQRVLKRFDEDQRRRTSPGGYSTEDILANNKKKE